MDGVTILNSFEVVVESVFSWKSFWIGTGATFVACWVVSLLISLPEIDWVPFIVATSSVSLIACWVGGVLFGFAIPEPVKYETRYEVYIDKTVNMREFMDKYETLETRGDIYIVREHID